MAGILTALAHFDHYRISIRHAIQDTPVRSEVTDHGGSVVARHSSGCKRVYRKRAHSEAQTTWLRFDDGVETLRWLRASEWRLYRLRCCWTAALRVEGRGCSSFGKRNVA